RMAADTSASVSVPRPRTPLSVACSLSANVSNMCEPSLALANERPGELPGLEWPQVLELLTDADQLDRDAELMGDRQRDAALGRPVELGQHQARDRHCV